MIIGVHTLLYSTDRDATRRFFQGAMHLSSVDAGRGWLIFALPPAELVTTIRIPGDVELGLYQPYHPTALAIAAEQSARYVGGVP